MSRYRSLGYFGTALLILTILILLLVPGAWAGSKSTTLHRFKRFTGGRGPEAGLIFDQSGNLYGTTAGGGDHGRGTVFELTPNKDGSWTERVLYSFCPSKGCADGKVPLDSLIFDGSGSLYGTTSYGGISGNGTAFKLTPDSHGGWTESVLYNFTAGENPRAGLIFDHSGNLYGTTTGGGDHQKGKAFELTPHSDGSWTESVLYTFCSAGGCRDGGSPVAGLIFDGKGNLYGTANLGGFNCPTGEGQGCGVAFTLTPNADGTWTESVLHRFDGKDGSGPAASLIFDKKGDLYGTTARGGNLSDCSGFGCGTVFELTPNSDGSWKESVLHRFTGGNGSGPLASLIFDQAGNLYGTTVGGGNSSCSGPPAGCGVVFKLSPNSKGGWNETVLQYLSNHPGAYPHAGLIFDGSGNLFGTTLGDGIQTFGSVFEISP